MNLSRRGREWYNLELTTDPEVAGWEASFDNAATWVAGTADTIVEDGNTIDVYRWLVAGPNAPEDAIDPDATLATRVVPKVRATDNPEIIVRNAPPIHLVA